jgi:hypothetical protein
VINLVFIALSCITGEVQTKAWIATNSLNSTRPNTMSKFVDQPLASTNLDSQGERLSVIFLRQFYERMVGRRFPVHQQHDMSKRVAGYIENVRLVADRRNSGEWQLIGDVFVECGTINDILGGFSISGTEVLFCPEAASALIYLPFPHYNDSEFIAELLSDPELTVGKWIKKEAIPLGWVMLGSVIAFAITPVWDDVYKRKIAPRIDKLIERLLPRFQEKGLKIELVQIVLFLGAEVEVRIIPSANSNSSSLRSEGVHGGLKVVVDFLETDQKSNIVGVSRVVIFHDDSIPAYRLHRVEYADGDVVHLA